MNFENGFAKNDFLQYMFNEFTCYNNPHTRQLLENLVDYCIEKEGKNQGKLIDVLESLVPEITHNEVTKFFDNRTKETRYKDDYER